MVNSRYLAPAWSVTPLLPLLQDWQLVTWPRVVAVTKSSYEFGAEWLRAFDPGELPMPPDDLVRVIHALIEGLVMQRILTPELCPEEVFYAAFAALARQ